MRTIDERIVEMQFDNKQFERNAQVSINTIEKLKRSMQFNKEAKSFEEIERASKQVSLDQLSKNVDGIAQKFSAFGVIGVTALQNITNFVMNLGKQMIYSLSVAPLSQGFSEYELKMGSIQTIMMSTGASLEDVNKYLKELNEYADKTIYSFADMTSNIGKFTNAGVELEDAALAIQGVSNVAAVSGANANEASRAMYNFAQALSAGYVKLIDWKSIEVANMATVEFKNQLLEAAVAAGTLTKTEDGMYKTLKGTVLDATHNFNDTLQEQWMTTEVLVNTLRDYADETTDIGKKAFAAAQDVKTFTQLMDTLKEAAGSGWAMTWEILFGNFEEAKELWTSLSKSVGGFIDGMSDARNELLQTWKNLGGRADVIKAVTNSLNAILAVLTPIKNAFDDIFPPATAWRLWELTHSLREFTESLKISDEASDNLKRTFKGLFAVIHIGAQAFSALLGGIEKFAGKIFSTVGTFLGLTNEANGGLLGFTATIGDFFVSLDKTISETGIFTGAMESIWQILEPITDGIQHIIGSIANALSGFKSLDTDAPKEFADSISEHLSVFSVLGDILTTAIVVITGGVDKLVQLFYTAASKLADAWNAIMNAVSNSGDTAAFDIFNAGLMGVLITGLKKFMDSLGKITEGVGGFLGSIKDILGGVKDVLGAYQKELQAKILINIAIAIGILAAALAVLASIDAERLASALVGMSILFYELFGALSAYEKIIGPKGIAKAVSGVAFFIGLAAAMLILASAVKKLSALSWDELIKGLGGVAVMAAILIKSAKAINFESKGLIKTAVSFVIFGAALNAMASAVKKLGELSIEQLIKGLVSVAVVMNEVSMFAGQVNGAKVMSAATATILIGTAMIIFASAIEKIGLLPLDAIGQGLVGIGGSLMILAKFIKLVSGSSQNIISISIGLIGISTAMLILSKSIEGLGGMSWESLAKGFFTMAGSLLMMKAAVQGLETALPGAAAMLVMSGAVLTLAGAFRVIEQMSWEGIAKSFVVLAGAFAVFGAASVILAPVVPVMLSLGGAIALVGVGIGAIGAGVLAFAAGLTAISVAGVGASAAIVTLVGSIASLIPLILTQLGHGIVAAAGVITEGAPAIAEAFIAILSAIFVLIVEGAPKIAEGIAILLETLLNTVESHAPNFINSGWNILKSLLEGVRDHIGETAELAVDIATEFISSLGDQAPRLVVAGVDFIVKFINGVADAIEGGIPEIMDAIGGLVKSIVVGIKNGLLSFGSALFGSGEEMGNEVLSGVESSMDINSPSKKMAELGRYAALGLANGLENNTKSVNDAGKELGNSLLSSLQKTLKINSSSRLMRDEVGKWVAEGIAEGITKNMSPEEAAEKKAQNIVNAFKTEFDKLDLSDTTANLEYKLWSTTNPNASDMQMTLKQSELLAKQLSSQSERVELAQGRYLQTLKEFGENAKQTQEAYNEYLQQQIDLADILQSVNQVEEAKNKSSMSSQVAYAQWMAEWKDTLLKMGYGLEEIEAQARKESGFDPDAVQQNMTSDVQKATVASMETVSNVFTANAEKTFGTLTNSFGDYGKEYATSIGDGFISNFAKKKAEIFKELDNFEAQMNSRAKKIADVVSSILNSDASSPSITPVLDLSQVEKQAGQISDIVSPKSIEIVAKTAELAKNAINRIPSIDTETGAMVAQPVVNNYNFEQNNYSPESLSPTEIYRQSKNAFSAFEQRTKEPMR